MQTLCTLSHSVIATGKATIVDLLIKFQADKPVTQPKRRPLNLSLVIDRSGSMAGQPLKQAIAAAQSLVDHLQPQDMFSVVIYDDNVATVFAPQLVTNKDVIRTVLNKIHAGGCTNLSGGWLKGCEHVQANFSKDKINRVLLLTDGLANVGVTTPTVLINTAQKKAAEGVSTTTLGFGTQFNEDLLMGMAQESGGNFYFIQSADDMANVFKIELDSLGTLVAQDLTVKLHPESGVQIAAILNNYRTTTNGDVTVAMGDVYEIEDKLLLIELQIPALAKKGSPKILSFSYKYQAIVEEAIQQLSGEAEVTIQVASPEEAEKVPPDLSVLKQASQLRIARTKQDAVGLADKGDYGTAAQKLRDMIAQLLSTPLHESFEIAEEMDNLDYYAKQIENRNYSSTFRKEMSDQSYQARTRSRNDLKLRGLSSGSAIGLEQIKTADTGVLVKCFREGARLRVKVISDGYKPELHVQFPRSIRQEGITYVVDEIKESADGSYYRAVGNIRVLLVPGQEHLLQAPQVRTRTSPPKPSKAPKTAADLETTQDVGDGVIIQCVQEGAKLRARVVSDGYNPDWNIRFPRSIRELGILYVADEVIEDPRGRSYIACGKIRRLIQ